MKKLAIVLCLAAIPAAAQGQPPTPPPMPQSHIDAIRNAVSQQLNAAKAANPQSQQQPIINGSGKLPNSPATGGQH